MTDYDDFFEEFTCLAEASGFARLDEPTGRKFIHFVTGIDGFYYIASFEWSAFRIELELANRNLAQNMSLFRHLVSIKSTIQQELGSLQWVSEQRTACRTYSELSSSSISSDWETMMTWGLKTLNKFAKTFSTERLRLG